MYDTRDVLSPYQMEKGIKARMNAVVHDTKTLRYCLSHVLQVTAVLIDALNDFNCVDKQSLFELLPARTSTLARLINMV